ncbi:unnamed protein product [Hermetia illucens]|uniref:limulus clotting factor C n=1 Tax=Hermetia illucens TaxID=343691 RepID=A0A7R8UQ67_HERIL|nr:unnamed protein product [Hermetia illucens]
MYLLRFIVITLIYSWGRAFEIGPSNQNYTDKLQTLRMQLSIINIKQFERLIDGVCVPSCFIAVVAAQGWQDTQFYPDYQTFDPGYHSPPSIQQQQRHQSYNSESSKSSYTPIATIYQTRPHRQQQQQIQQYKPVHSSKHRSPIPTPKPNTSTSNRRGSIKPPSRRRFQNQGTQLNQVSAVQNQKVSSRQPVKRFVNSPLCGISVNTRIVGGREIAPGQFPWMARLAYRNRTSGKLTYRCAGSVISDRYIVTAAHCVTNLVSSLEVFLVRVGELDTKRNLDCELNPVTCVIPQDYDIQKIIPHEKYDSPKYANDIALIKLVRPLNATEITPICLPVDELASADKKLTGKTGIIAGWGSKIAGGVKQNPSLQYVLLPIVNRTKCATSYAQFSANSRTPIIVTESQICAQGMENMDACQGDSGGPLMIEGPSTNARFTLLGLVSFGPRTCGVSNFPGVYTRVSAYVDWIVSNMN